MIIFTVIFLILGIAATCMIYARKKSNRDYLLEQSDSLAEAEAANKDEMGIFDEN